MNILKYIFLIISCNILFSCNTDEPSSSSGNNQSNNGGNSPSTEDRNNSSTEDNYYFELERPAAREIKTDAGIIQIYFKTNQEYTISVTGNISGIKLSQLSGKGDGSVTVSFDKVQYKIEGHSITWNESGYINFTVKEGTKNDFKIVKKEYYIVRRGSKMKV